MSATRFDYPLPDGALADNDGSVPFHAMGNGHNWAYAKLPPEAFRPILNRLFHEMDRGGSFRQHNRKRGPKVRLEERHLSPRPALRDSDRQWLPVHIEQVSRILREVEDPPQLIKPEIPAE